MKLARLRFTVVWVTAVLALNSFVTRSRMSHENGIVTRGRLRIVDEPTFPRNEFFTPGTAFPCRMRFGAATWKDDAKMVIRGAGLKFADDRDSSPLDLLLNSGSLADPSGARAPSSGSCGARWPAAGRLDAVPRRATDGAGRRPGRHAARPDIGRLDRLPLADMLRSDRSRRQRVLRAVPAVAAVVRAGWDADARRPHAPWFQNPLPDETRNRNYLKDEARARLSGGTIEFTLQLQARRRPPGPDPEWVTAQYLWDDTVHPWHDVAHIVLDEALDYAESMLTGFDLGHHPDCLPLPQGALDRRSALADGPAPCRSMDHAGAAAQLPAAGHARRVR